MTEDSSQISQASDAAFNDYIRRARETKKKTPDVFIHGSLEPEERARRTVVMGAVLGIAVSLLFALTAQGLNLLLLPGLPLFRSILDPLINMAVITITGTILSMISVSSFKIQNRFVVLALALEGLFVFYDFYRAFGNIIAGIMEGLAFSFIFLIPILFALLCAVPFWALVRWAVGAQVKYFYRPVYYWKRGLPVLLLVTVAVLCGSIFVYSPPELKAARALDTLVRQSLVVERGEELPEPVQRMWGTPFFPYAYGNYMLMAPHNPFPNRVTSNGTPYVMPIDFTVQFQSGYWFTCRFDPKGILERCSSYYTPPEPKVIGQVGE